MSQNGGQPVFILKEGSNETKGKEAQKWFKEPFGREKEKLIEKIKAGEPPKVEEKSSDQVDQVEDGEEKRELSEWEKRLEGIS